MGFPIKYMSRNSRSIDGATLTTSYQNVGVVTTIVGYKIYISNGTSTDVQVSDSSSNDPWYVPANTVLRIDEGVSGFGAQLDRLASTRKGAQLQAKLPSGAAGTGTLAITIIGS